MKSLMQTLVPQLSNNSLISSQAIPVFVFFYQITFMKLSLFNSDEVFAILKHSLIQPRIIIENALIEVLTFLTNSHATLVRV